MILTGIAGWLLHATEYYNMIMNLALIVLIIVGIASFVAKLTGWLWDDVAIDSVRGKLLKAMAILPTFGTNPLTKQMFEIIKEMDRKSDEQDKEDAQQDKGTEAS